MAIKEVVIGKPKTQTVTKSYNLIGYDGELTFDFEFSFPKKVLGITAYSHPNFTYGGTFEVSIVGDNTVRVKYYYAMSTKQTLEMTMTAIGN